jgi:hypothetical protein
MVHLAKETGVAAAGIMPVTRPSVAACSIFVDVKMAQIVVLRRKYVVSTIPSRRPDASPDQEFDEFAARPRRVSFEMAQKAAMAGVSAPVGMSAPTLAAVDLAGRAGMTLLAFVRGRDFVCYTHADSLGLA